MPYRLTASGLLGPFRFRVVLERLGPLPDGAVLTVAIDGELHPPLS